MIRQLSYFALLTVFTFTLLGCFEEDNNTPLGVPYEPTRDQLEAGPEPGKSFLQWNATGLQRGEAHGYEVTMVCYHGIATDIVIPDMLGLEVEATSLAEDSLECTIEVSDTIFTQTEYLPEGITWADSVAYWVDSTVVQWPVGVTDGHEISFYWYNRNTGAMIQVQTDYNESRWVAKTLHFSRYVLGQKRTGS